MLGFRPARRVIRGAVSIHTILRLIERLIAAISIGAAWFLLPLLVLVRVFDIVARQYISTPSNLIQVIEWRAFLFLVLLSFGYTYLRNAHIRIDILRNRLSPTAQAWIELGGCLLLVLPFCIVVIGYGVDYAWQSYLQGEREPIALGRPLQWLVKGTLPFGALLLFLAGVVVFARNSLFILGHEDQLRQDESDTPHPDGVKTRNPEFFR